jgi:hypothetical protein
MIDKNLIFARLSRNLSRSYGVIVLLIKKFNSFSVQYFKEEKCHYPNNKKVMSHRLAEIKVLEYFIKGGK